MDFICIGWQCGGKEDSVLTHDRNNLSVESVGHGKNVSKYEEVKQDDSHKSEIIPVEKCINLSHLDENVQVHKKSDELNSYESAKYYNKKIFNESTLSKKSNPRLSKERNFLVDSKLDTPKPTAQFSPNSSAKRTSDYNFSKLYAHIISPKFTFSRDDTKDITSAPCNEDLANDFTMESKDATNSNSQISIQQPHEEILGGEEVKRSNNSFFNNGILSKVLSSTPRGSRQRNFEVDSKPNTPKSNSAASPKSLTRRTSEYNVYNLYGSVKSPEFSYSYDDVKDDSKLKQISKTNDTNIHLNPDETSKNQPIKQPSTPQKNQPTKPTSSPGAVNHSPLSIVWRRALAIEEMIRNRNRNNKKAKDFIPSNPVEFSANSILEDDIHQQSNELNKEQVDSEKNKSSVRRPLSVKTVSFSLDDGKISKEMIDNGPLFKTLDDKKKTKKKKPFKKERLSQSNNNVYDNIGTESNKLSTLLSPSSRVTYDSIYGSLNSPPINMMSVSSANRKQEDVIAKLRAQSTNNLNSSQILHNPAPISKVIHDLPPPLFTYFMETMEHANQVDDESFDAKLNDSNVSNNKHAHNQSKHSFIKPASFIKPSDGIETMPSVPSKHLVTTDPKRIKTFASSSNQLPGGVGNHAFLLDEPSKVTSSLPPLHLSTSPPSTKHKTFFKPSEKYSKPTIKEIDNPSSKSNLDLNTQPLTLTTTQEVFSISDAYHLTGSTTSKFSPRDENLNEERSSEQQSPIKKVISMFTKSTGASKSSSHDLNPTSSDLSSSNSFSNSEKLSSLRSLITSQVPPPPPSQGHKASGQSNYHRTNSFRWSVQLDSDTNTDDQNSPLPVRERKLMNSNALKSNQNQNNFNSFYKSSTSPGNPNADSKSGSATPNTFSFDENIFSPNRSSIQNFYGTNNVNKDGQPPFTEHLYSRSGIGYGNSMPRDSQESRGGSSVVDHLDQKARLSFGDTRGQMSSMYSMHSESSSEYYRDSKINAMLADVPAVLKGYYFLSEDIANEKSRNSGSFSAEQLSKILNKEELLANRRSNPNNASQNSIAWKPNQLSKILSKPENSFVIDEPLSEANATLPLTKKESTYHGIPPPANKQLNQLEQSKKLHEKTFRKDPLKKKKHASSNVSIGSRESSVDVNFNISGFSELDPVKGGDTSKENRRPRRKRLVKDDSKVDQITPIKVYESNPLLPTVGGQAVILDKKKDETKKQVKVKKEKKTSALETSTMKISSTER